MIREIVTDEEILSKPCEAATTEDAAIADDLVETLLASDEAMCLAANQIGETRRIIAYLNDAGRPQVMYNPRIAQKLKPYTAVEACLSREEPTAVTRYDWVRVSYEVLADGKLIERKKKLEGNAAQAVESWAKPYDFDGVPEGFTVTAKAKLDETGTAAFPDAATCRDAGRPYDGTNDRWVMDTFIYSDNVECLDCSTVDLDFAYSDHNPVAMTFKLR